jgi:FdhE protein
MPSQEMLLQLDRRLESLKKARPELASVIAFQGALARESLSAAREPRVSGFPLPHERVVSKVREGVPLLNGEPAFVDVHYAADLFSRLVNVVLEHGDEEARGRVGPLVAAATDGRLEADRLFAEAFVQHREHLRDIAGVAGVDADLLDTLSALSVAPLLRTYAVQLAPLVERADDGSPHGATWEKGYCPICGAWPVLAELRGVEQQRFLRCSACGTGWRTLRLFCPYCGNDEFRQLSYLQIEGERRFKVEVCARCNGYLKAANAFDPSPADLLALDDLASVHLDMAAIERGYRRPSTAGFHLELAIPEDEWVEDLASMDVD